MVEISSTCCTCKGITKSLGLIYEIYEKELIKEDPKRICLYNNKINNKAVIKELTDLGIVLIGDIEEAKGTDIVLLNPFGEPKDIYDYLNDNNIEYYDLICPTICKINKLVIEKYNKGYEIVIVGNKDSLDVINLNTFIDNNATVINNDKDFINLNDNKNKFIICSRSFNNTEYEELVMKLNTLYDTFNLEYNKTYCKELNKINDSINNLVDKVDNIFIIGDEDDKYTQDIINNINKKIKFNTFNDKDEFINYILSSRLNNNSKIALVGTIFTPIKELYNYKYLLLFLLFYKKSKKEININNNIINEYLNEKNTLLKEFIKELKTLNQDYDNIDTCLISLGELISNNKEDLDYIGLAEAYNLLKTSIYVHEDIIDNRKMRNNKETIPRKVCQKYLNLHNHIDKQDESLILANQIGIESSNYGLSVVNNIILKNYDKHINIISILNIFNEIFFSRIKGKYLEEYSNYLIKYHNHNLNKDNIMDNYYLKNTIFSIIGPFKLGYALANKSISDDLLDILTDIGLLKAYNEELLNIFNPSIVGDYYCIGNIYNTFIYNHLLDINKEDILINYNSNLLNEKEYNKIINIVHDTNTYDYILSLIDDLTYNIMEKIDNINLKDNYKNILKGFIIYINKAQRL